MQLNHQTIKQSKSIDKDKFWRAIAGLMLLWLIAAPPANADPVTDCTDFGGINSTQICIGEGRTWILTGDDTLTAFPFVVTFNGNLDFTAIASIPNPGNLGPNDFDKFYIITENVFFVPVDERVNFPGEILGPFMYGLPPDGNAIQFGFDQLTKILAMQAKGNIVIIEQEVDHDIFNPLVEAFGPIEFKGTLPPAPPTPPATTVTGSSGANFNFSASCGEPINLFTGELFNQYPTDIFLDSPLPLTFSRYYASGLKPDNIMGAMGDNWRHNFEWQLTQSGDTLDIVTQLGRLLRFNKNQNQWLLVSKQDITYQLIENAEAATFTLVDPRDNHAYLFNADGLLSKHSDNVGNNHTLSYDANKLLTKVADGLGRTLTYGYDPSARLTSITDDNNRTLKLAYTDSLLTSSTDILGNTTVYTYTNDALMTATKHALGNSHHSQTFNTDGKVASQTDALANISKLNYSDSNTTWTDPLGNIYNSTHNDAGAVSSVIRQDESTVSMSSNEAGQRSGFTDALGSTTNFSYHTQSSRLSGISHADGTTTTNTFATRTLTDQTQVFDHTATTHADGSIDAYVYDSLGNLTSHTNRAGHVVRFTHNDNGQWLTRTNEVGGVAKRTFNADATLATHTDVSANKTTYSYDAMRRLTTVTFANGDKQSFSYDLMDRPLTITDGKGNVSTYSYDANGNQSKITDRMGASLTFTYDAMDRVSQIIDDDNTMGAMTFDALGRPATMTNRNATTYQFGYNALSRPSQFTDGNNNTWQQTFNSEGIVASITSPKGHATTYTSDSMSRITKMTTPLAHAYQFAFDDIGNLNQITDPLGNIVSQTHDARSQVSASTLPESISASYQRNGLGLITTVTDPNQQQWQRTIDTNGRTTTSTDPLMRNVAFEYDNRNRVSKTQFAAQMGSFTTSFDANGNIIRKLYSDGTDLTFEYNNEDRLISSNNLALTRDSLGQVTNSNGIEVGHDSAGRITSVAFTDDKSVSYSYDGNANLAMVTDWLGGVSSFSYDKDNQMISMTRPNGVTATFDYDNDGHLSGFAQGMLADTILTRDAKNQIIAATRNTPTAATASTLLSQNHSYDVAAQVSTEGFSYDAMGRLTQKDDTGFDWDLASRLTTVGDTNYSYDGMGMQLTRTTPQDTRQYAWNYALAIPSISIEKQNGADKRYYVHTPSGALLYSVDATDNSRRFYHFDEMGNTRFMTDDAANISATYAHTPFGQLIKSTGEPDNPFTWQGRFGVMAQANGLYYVRARFYDSNTARFISPDSIDQVQQMFENDPAQSSAFSFMAHKKLVNPMLLNPYQFANANPLAQIDIDGNEPITIGVVLGGIGAAFTGLYKAGKQLELADINEQVARENARLLKAMDDPVCVADGYAIEAKINSKRVNAIIDSSQTLASSVPGTSFTGPETGAPVSDVSQTITQRVIKFFSWDK